MYRTLCNSLIHSFYAQRAGVDVGAAYHEVLKHVDGLQGPTEPGLEDSPSGHASHTAIVVAPTSPSRSNVVAPALSTTSMARSYTPMKRIAPRKYSSLLQWLFPM